MYTGPLHFARNEKTEGSPVSGLSILCIFLKQLGLFAFYDEASFQSAQQEEGCPEKVAREGEGAALTGPPKGEWGVVHPHPLHTECPHTGSLKLWPVTAAWDLKLPSRERQKL